MRRWLLLFVFLLTGCRSAQAAPEVYVDFRQREPLPAIAVAEVLPLRIAVAAIISPQGNAESYADLAEYLGDKLGRPVELVQRRTYAEVNRLIEEHDVDVAFVCTSAYIDGHDSFGMELLVAPVISDELVYYSELIIPASSQARTMADLAGRVFAFTDPMSFSGRVYPTHLVHELGQEPEEFFSRVFFTYSHDRAIESVAAGIADGAAVDSLVLDYALKRDPSLAGRIRVIHRSPPFGIPPVVIPPGIPPWQRVQLQETFLAMHEDLAGSAILADLGIDRFQRLDDAAYVDARNLILDTGGIE